MKSKNIISVRIRQDNVEDFHLLKEYLSETNPILADINNNHLVNHCIDLALDRYQLELEKFKKDRGITNSNDDQS